MPLTIPEPHPPHPPVHAPDRTGPNLRIDRCGAVGDGRTLCTGAIQRAIDQVVGAGGGTVRIPAGTWLTGALHLGSGLTLQLDAGAVLLGSDRWQDYGDGHWHEALLRAECAEGIRIVGPGTIDGQDCFNPAGEGGQRGPHGLWLDRCKDVVIREVGLRRIGNWGIAAWHCTDLTFDRYRVQGGHDGVDIENCRRIAMVGCDFETGDDNIAGPGNSDLLLRDCRLNSSCNCLRISCERMRIEHCRFEGPGRFEHRFTNGRHNTLAAITHFSPAERGYRGLAPHSDHWLIDDCVIADIDCILDHDIGHVWQDARGIGLVVFRRVQASGFCQPIIANCSMRGYRREFSLFLDDCILEPRRGSEDCGYIDLRRHGRLGLRRVTLRGNGASRPIRAIDGGPVEIDDLSIDVRQALPAPDAATVLDQLNGFVFSTPPQPTDSRTPDLPTVAGAQPVGDLRDGPVRGRWWRLPDGDDLLALWSTESTEVAIRGLLRTVAAQAGSSQVAASTAPRGERPDRGIAWRGQVSPTPLLLRGVGLEVVAAV